MFKDLFMTLIDSNNKLNRTLKLYYLKSNFSHFVLNAITADDSYESFFKALVSHFENKRFIVSSHVNEIFFFK